MWHRQFSDRLSSWTELRTTCSQLPVEQALANINKWWFNAPWTPYHLHWDEQLTWPDPWQLLDDNIFCPLARGLGILYTITMLERSDMQDAVLIEVGSDNLVQFAGGKYMLNWDPDDIVNINLSRLKVRHSVSQDQIKKQIK